MFPFPSKGNFLLFLDKNNDLGIILYNCWPGPYILAVLVKMTGNLKFKKYFFKCMSVAALEIAYGVLGLKLKFSFNLSFDDFFNSYK